MPMHGPDLHGHSLLICFFFLLWQSRAGKMGEIHSGTEQNILNTEHPLYVPCQGGPQSRIPPL